MPVFFNNCHAYDHAGMYGAGAFYDLNRTGRQAKMATGLKDGDECVVATPTEDGEIEFSWFAFSREEIMPDEDGRRMRVFFGKHLRSEVLPKAQAARTLPYSAFFNVNGHFKRPSVINPRGRNPRQLALGGC